MRVLKRFLAILITGQLCFSPAVLFAQPQPVARTEQGYTPVVPAVGNTEEANPGTQPEPELPNPNYYNPNPLSRPDTPGAIGDFPYYLRKNETGSSSFGLIY